VELPHGARVSADMCSRLIEDLTAARDLVKKWRGGERFNLQAGVQTPTSAQLSMGGYGQLADKPPTEKQLALAEVLASQAGTEVPQNARRSFRQCSMFIHDIKATTRSQAWSNQAWNFGSRW